MGQCNPAEDGPAGRAFLNSEAIDVTTYGRQRDKLREELTLAKIHHHAEAVDELRATARQPSRGLPSRSSQFGIVTRERRLVSLNVTSWNQMERWFRDVDALRRVA